MTVPETASSVDTHCLPASPQAVALAANVLQQGGLVAFPTETVYGLGADARNPAALKALFAAKGRPADHPVIVHLADASQLDPWVRDVPAAARALASAFWPGPMTLILSRSEQVSDLITGGMDTVGVRVPGHPVAQALLRAFGGAIAAPSANRFGRVSPTRAEHVMAELSGHIPLVLDGGPCSIGLESTIVDLSGDQPAVLRPGAVTAEQIAEVLGAPPRGADYAAPRVSGSLASHYAPRATVELVAKSQLLERAALLAGRGLRVAILSSEPLEAPPGVMVLLTPNDESSLARALYETLRRVDELECDVALTSLPEARGLGLAITDRLLKAAGPRRENG